MSPDSHSGWLLCLRQQMLMAQPFDAAGLRLTGEPVAIADHVAVDRFDEAAFWASDAGILVYHTGTINSALSWVTRLWRRCSRREQCRGRRRSILPAVPESQ